MKTINNCRNVTQWGRRGEQLCWPTFCLLCLHRILWLHVCQLKTLSRYICVILRTNVVHFNHYSSAWLSEGGGESESKGLPSAAFCLHATLFFLVSNVCTNLLFLTDRYDVQLLDNFIFYYVYIYLYGFTLHFLCLNGFVVWQLTRFWLWA